MSAPRPIQHGTPGGYSVHMGRGEPIPAHDPCGCRAAAAEAKRRERAAGKRSPELAPFPYTPEQAGQQACAGIDTEIFFPTVTTGGPEAQHLNEPAKRLCRSCKFRDACLAYALDRPALWGVWGGLTMKEREELRRRNRRSA